MKVAFIGLGVMGFPMAGHLQAAGHQVTVYNRNPEKAAAWVKTHGGESAATPQEAAAGAEIPMGRMGTLTLDENTNGAMADPFVYDSSNIDEFKSIF